MGYSAKTGKKIFWGSQDYFLHKSAIWDRTAPPPTHQMQSTCVQEGSRVPNLEMEFNYLDSFKSYAIFSDFVVPAWSPWSPRRPCHPHIIPIIPTLSPHHPHIVPIASRRSPCGPHGCGVCGLCGLHPCCPRCTRGPHIVPVIPTSSPSSPHHPYII